MNANWMNANLKNEVEITQQFVNVGGRGGDLGSTKSQSPPFREGSSVRQWWFNIQTSSDVLRRVGDKILSV